MSDINDLAYFTMFYFWSEPCILRFLRFCELVRLVPSGSEPCILRFVGFCELVSYHHVIHVSLRFVYEKLGPRSGSPVPRPERLSALDGGVRQPMPVADTVAGLWQLWCDEFETVPWHTEAGGGGARKRLNRLDLQLTVLCSLFAPPNWKFQIWIIGNP